ncbi:MAG TPA: undecaprenyl-diphosphate phosphatase [Acidimicrobiales bacterium]|nr:undecaprenyl-diphosphate phosphatase [Acidimicrobiales bacterium]
MFAATAPLTYLQAIVLGALQGVTELFPVSSLGHTVLLPGLLGWDNLVKAQSQPESFFLAFVVGLHVATALALLVYFWRDWDRIIRGFFRSLRARKMDDDPDARLAWLIVLGTIPVGLVGLVFEHPLRTLFAKPEAAAIFLMINGLILLGGEWLRRRDDAHAGSGKAPRRALATLHPVEGVVVGSSQILALFAGISRSGVTMVAGLYKIPDLMGSNGNGIRGQVVVGSIAAGIAAYVSVRFLLKYFETRTLTPFAIYCLAMGAFCVVRFA